MLGWSGLRDLLVLVIVAAFFLVGISFDVRAMGRVRDPKRRPSYLDLWLRPEVFTEEGKRLRQAGMRYYLFGVPTLLLVLWVLNRVG